MDGKELHNLLFSAIQHHNDSLLGDLLDGECGRQFLDTPGDDGNSLLHTAVLENNLRCVECLLKHGANPNVFDTNRARTPLHLAVELGEIKIVKAFFDLDYIDLDIRDDRNLTCYEIAQFCDKPQLVDLIKTRYDDGDQLRNDFYSVINQACASNNSALVRELLERHKSKFLKRLPKGWRSIEDRELFACSKLRELINWSSSSWNDVTLLFKSASKGQTEICRLLIEFGASAKCNENTNYSPLYIAAYGGYTETVKLLLDRFPSLVSEITIEKWTVLHACCLQGHSEAAKLVLTYPYPENLKRRFISRSGEYEYQFAFDLNAQDAAGQTVIYLAVSANDEKLLDGLLQFKVEAKFLKTPNQSNESRPVDYDKQKSHGKNPTSATRLARIIPDRPKATTGFHKNEQLNKIIRQLRNLDAKQDSKSDYPDLKENNDDERYLICPFEMDTYCDYNSKTALHLAVCQQYHSIATTLLVNGSNPNLPILSRDSMKSDFNSYTVDTGLNWLRLSKSTCLKEASRLNDGLMCEILIRYGGNDNQDNLALQVAASNKNSLLISKFLALKSNVDPEYKINKKCNVEFASRYRQNQSKSTHTNTTTTFSSMFPSAPVMIDWQNLKCIKQIDPQWLIDASLIHNKRLKHPTTSLMSITRLDLSSNNLKCIHPVIFRLPSLRELNLSKNRLESLMDFNQRQSIGSDAVPTSKLIESHRIAMKRSKSSNLSSIGLESSNIIDLNEPQEWDLPFLEILDLHDNLLISLPDCLFELPKLSELDVSSNQIRQLPWSMWTSPSLKEVIASGNLLDDLPRAPPTSCASPNLRLGCSESPTDEGSSLTSNQSASLDQADRSFLSNSDSEIQKDQLSILQSSNSLEVTQTQLKSVPIPVNHMNHWTRRVEMVSNATLSSKSPDEEKGNHHNTLVSKITYLNLSHNSFATLPPILACIATELTRLNLSSNRISKLGDISMYPAKLKNIDLSNNQITSWFQKTRQDDDPRFCYAENVRRDSTVTKFLYGGGPLCIHKMHQRLDNLKLFNLSHNMLTDIQLFGISNAPESGVRSISRRTSSSLSPNNDSRDQKTSSRESLLYPNITALDLSYNKIKSVPIGIRELKDLSVLNLNGNQTITTLPAELGLASKLWNLGVNGCNLSEPLKSIVESKTYKTMDIIGYLRSILEEAKPYARMKLMLVGLQGIGKTSLLEQMRLEGSSGSRRRAPEHWTRRMGHATRSNLRNQRGVTLSTVGVDIHDWMFCKRTPRNQPNFGPVSFSTWDFGGQHEFYATHRYFLSRRSIYLVVWRLTDGLDGILGIQQWLVNIQSRASGSPVIIVGTHEDMIEGGERGEKVRRLQAEIKKRFIDIPDRDRSGLPCVMDSFFVSTKTKLNIKNLCNRIYDVVFSLRCPGSSERLLEQKIPATYLYLEEIVNYIVHGRQQQRREPVLTYEEYKRITSEQLKLKYNKVFRDLEPLESREINYNSELHQATRFLHENGVLLHYEDANLRDLFFLDPQWLCDILSHVVTIREINPHVKNGLMKIDDLGFLFKSNEVTMSEGIQSYVVNLLNKFEVALTWNSQYLLIPSLLPTDPEAINQQQDFQIKMAPRLRGRSVTRRYDGSSTNRNIAGAVLRSTSIDPGRKGGAVKAKDCPVFSVQNQTESAVHRLVLLRYLPAGFFARLQSGILSDPTFDDVCSDLQTGFLTCLAERSNNLRNSIGNRAGWTCWSNGIKLSLQHESTINSSSKNQNDDQIPVHLLTIRELSTISRQEIFKVNVQNGNEMDNSDNWSEFDISQFSNIILVTIPKWRLKMITEDGLIQFVEPDYQCIAKLLSNSVEQIDNLLEDWYPSLGTRFAHTLGGNYLVTRVIPCISCFSPDSLKESSSGDQGVNQRSSRLDSRPSRSSTNRVNFSIGAAGDRSLDTESPQKALLNLTNNHLNCSDIYCYYVEHCILKAYDIASSSFGAPNSATAHPSPVSIGKYQNPLATSRITGRNLHCPRHGNLKLSILAPDIVFDDVPNHLRIENDQIDRCKLIGRGTFGFVFRGSLRGCSYPMNQLSHANQEVALKLLQPVDPGPEADQSDLLAYKSAKANWLREPFQSACKSYCTARHEVNILQTLQHPNIVLFNGLCVKPLAIVLELAPMGCLNDVFKNYKRAGMRIDQYSAQKSILQIARALEFMHQQRIIYRDLKAENVLVWSFPSPFATKLKDAIVELKLADYGISRQALSTGTWKGFAGTINFLAPEILRHNGDEEYTEKVDCFSFGMFMYELLTLRPPFKHNEGMKSHLVDGGRPLITARDLVYPNYMIDLMSVCWSQEPHHRPTASQIVSITSTPEFMQLLDVVALEDHDRVDFCGAIQYFELNNSNLDLWLGDRSFKTHVLSTNHERWTEYEQLYLVDDSGADNHPGIQATCICVVDEQIWLCDINMMIHVLPIGFRGLMVDLGEFQQQKTQEHPRFNDQFNRAQSFPLNIHRAAGSKTFVSQMTFVKPANCVILLLNNGQLWHLQLASMFCCQLDDSSIPYQCMAVQNNYVQIKKPSPDESDEGQNDQLSLSNDESFHIFCGQANGISCLEILHGTICRQSILPLAGKMVDMSGERILESGQSTEVTSIVASKDLLWTSVGCTIHLWVIKDKRVARGLDCWKLVPCSESLESINIEEYYIQARSSVVSSMVLLNNQLFVGTSHGCFMVVEADSLKPMTVFRPYESNIKILVPTMVGANPSQADDEDASRYLVTIGTGYRDLMKRFVNSLDYSEGQNAPGEVAILWSAIFDF